MADTAHTGSAPISERFSLDDLVNEAAGDLRALRAGSISIEDARVRAEMLKQIMSGVRLIIAGQRYLEDRAKQIASGPGPEIEPDAPGGNTP